MRLLPVLLAFSCLVPAPLAAWGAKGHELVASAAFRDLPADLAPWFQDREQTLVDHCNDPDHWKDYDPKEGPRHFLDSEAYGGPAAVPRDIKEAEARLGTEAFQKDGQVTWVIQDRVRSLADAFRDGDPDQVTLQAAILCHYVGDLSVPLHTTANYDGEGSGQKGVHRRWETGLVERLGDWEPEVRTPGLGADPWSAPWDWLQSSNALVAGLLQDDLEASGRSRQDRESVYWREFKRRQLPKVKEQLALAGQRTARMILLAWNLAGSPMDVHGTFSPTEIHTSRPGSSTRSGGEG
jgi:hypothetical protein